MYLPVILEKYGDEIEADFQQYYGLDLLDFYRGDLKPAKTYRLVCALPVESRFARKVGGPRADWQTDQYLLADIRDQLAAANWQRGGGKGPKPKPTPRPGQQSRTTHYGKTKRTNKEILGYFAKIKSGELEGKLNNGD
jgi:hypothetical protein